MTEDELRVQRALEGKCTECGVLLPGHTTECPEHPNRVIVDWLQTNRKKLEKITQNKLNKDTTLNTIMKKIRKQIKGGDDV